MGLDPGQAIDRRALVAQLEAARFELTELRLPFREPMFYAGPSELDVSFYVQLPYAPLEDRFAALRRHLLGYGGFLEAARDNLEAVLPRPNLEIAIEAVDGQVAYLDGEVRAAAAGHAETLKAIEVASTQLRDFGVGLQARVATADDAYALGTDHFLRLLDLREFVQLDVPALERMVRADIDRNRADAEAAARRTARNRRHRQLLLGDGPPRRLGCGQKRGMVALHELRHDGRHLDPRGVSRPLRPGSVRAAGHIADASTVLDVQHRRRLCPLR